MSVVPQVCLSAEAYMWGPRVRVNSGKEKEKGLLVHWALNIVGPARLPNSARLKEVDRLGRWLEGQLGLRFR